MRAGAGPQGQSARVRLQGRSARVQLQAAGLAQGVAGRLGLRVRRRAGAAGPPMVQTRATRRCCAVVRRCSGLRRERRQPMLWAGMPMRKGHRGLLPVCHSDRSWFALIFALAYRHVQHVHLGSLKHIRFVPHQGAQFCIITMQCTTQKSRAFHNMVPGRYVRRSPSIASYICLALPWRRGRADYSVVTAKFTLTTCAQNRPAMPGP